MKFSLPMEVALGQSVDLEVDALNGVFGGRLSILTKIKPGFLVPSTIDSSGGQDVTKELLAFFASVPDDSTIIFPPHGNYRIDGTLRLIDRKGLTVEGNDSVFFTEVSIPVDYQTPNADYPWRGRSHWSIEGGSEITLRNLTVKGSNRWGGRGDAAYSKPLEAQHGVNIAGASNVLIENINISHVHGDFVYAGATYRNINPPGTKSKYVFVPSQNVTISGGNWGYNGRQGIGVSSCTGLLVDGISMTETRRASIDLEPNSKHDVIRDVTIRNSYFGPGKLLWLASKGGPGVMENILIENNRLDRGAQVYIRGLLGARRRNIRFLNNISTIPSGGGNFGLWSLWRIDGFEAYGNVAPLNESRSHPGLWAYDVTGLIAPEGQWPGGRGVQVYESPTP